MTARHRGVDRTVSILETVARSHHGLTLTELARSLEAPVSSIQQLVNGLVAVGFLSEDERRYTLGPGAFALTMNGDWSTVAPISHRLVEQLSVELDCSIVVGLLVGDNLMYFDEAGRDPSIEYHARSRIRRPILRSSGGKRLLADLPDAELQQRVRHLGLTHPADEVDSFLREVPQIRASGLAIGTGVPGLLGIAAGVPGRRGRLAAALIALGPVDGMRPRVAEIGAALFDAVEHETGSKPAGTRAALG